MESSETHSTPAGRPWPVHAGEDDLAQDEKRDGTWVGTPVSIVVDDDRAYVRTYDKSWKSKRLRNFPEVRFAPSTFRGKPTGQELCARARLLGGEERRGS